MLTRGCGETTGAAATTATTIGTIAATAGMMGVGTVATTIVEPESGLASAPRSAKRSVVSRGDVSVQGSAPGSVATSTSA